MPLKNFFGNHQGHLFELFMNTAKGHLELSKSMFLSGIYKIKHTEDSLKCFACEGEQLQGNNQLHLIG